MDSAQGALETLRQKIITSNLPQDVLEKLQEDLSRVAVFIKANQVGPEVDREISYINFVCSLPWNNTTQDILDISRSKQILDKNHYGMQVVKDRILEYLSVLILNKKKGQVPKQPILGFVGLVGSGKTSLAYSIAESLGRPIIRIPFGGLGSALQLRGESRVKLEAEPGLVMKALKRNAVKNPVILLDELDRVADDARNDIMGVLVELLDPEQNIAFLDHYVSFPFDLSQVLFIATANNLTNIAAAVLDRIEVIEMPFYTDEQKIVIGRDYLLPQALKNAGVDPKLIEIDADVWVSIIRPLGFDGGIRSLSRNIDMMVRRIARSLVEAGTGSMVYKISTTNLGEFLEL